MAQARRAKAKIQYRGRDVSDYVLDFSYTDNYDRTDDLRVTLSDRDERWTDELFPETGDTLQAAIQVFDWNSRNDNRTIKLGTFEIDDVSHSGVVSIACVAAPITSSCRSERKNRAWKKIKLSAIAGDISGTAGLALIYDTDVNPFYDVADQNDKADLEFLEELCKSDGLCIKVTDGQLIVFEESKYEAKAAVATIVKGSSDIIGVPRFRRKAKEVYKACEIAHFDPKTDQVYIGYFEAPNVGDVWHTLKLREHFNSESDDISLDRKAKARCREKNKREWTCDIGMKGDIIYFAGVNVEYEGWHKFDGKYHIATATHSIGSGGYTVSLGTRRCLEGY